MLIKLESRYNKARMHLVAGFFDCYLPINVKKDVQLLEQEERVKVMELMSSWQRKGFEEGRQEGRKEGRRETAKKLLEMGLSLSQVAEATRLTMKEIEQINREMTI